MDWEKQRNAEAKEAAEGWQGGARVQCLLGRRRAHAHLLCLRAQGHAKPHECDGDQGQRVGGRKGGQQQHKQGDVQAPFLRAASGSKRMSLVRRLAATSHRRLPYELSVAQRSD